jgi:hypothetical protein
MPGKAAVLPFPDSLCASAAELAPSMRCSKLPTLLRLEYGKLRRLAAGLKVGDWSAGVIPRAN